MWQWWRGFGFDCAGAMRQLRRTWPDSLLRRQTRRVRHHRRRKIRAHRGGEVVLAAAFDGNTAKGTWSLREKANGNEVATGGWTVTRK
jgi:hypothetical protein